MQWCIYMNKFVFPKKKKTTISLWSDNERNGKERCLVLSPRRIQSPREGHLKVTGLLLVLFCVCRWDRMSSIMSVKMADITHIDMLSDWLAVSPCYRTTSWKWQNQLRMVLSPSLVTSPFEWQLGMDPWGMPWLPENYCMLPESGKWPTSLWPCCQAVYRQQSLFNHVSSPQSPSA